MISVIIPAYKNKVQFLDYLKNNLSFLKNCEVIVINDDPSESLAPDLKSLKEVTLIENKKNLGFGRTVNIGVAAAQHRYLLLLNTDVKLTDSSFKHALSYFEKDPSLFAVSFGQKEKDGNLGGKNTFYWKKGFFYHAKADNLAFGPTGWAEGGSCLIDKTKFLELGGFDELFTPFYWEDTDLSYRAWKNGYRVLFDPKIMVEHHHSSTISQYIKSDYKDTIAARNHFIFIWKNITDNKLMNEHVFYLPYNLLYFAYKKNFFFLKGFFMALTLLFFIAKKRNYRAIKNDREVFKLVNQEE